jgi:hypothetical protein
LELPDGKGIVLGVSCALCEKPLESGIVCPVCLRYFCADGCFGVHLVARDGADEDTDGKKHQAAFHRHLDTCGRCRTQPFNLCDIGITLLGEDDQVKAVRHRRRASRDR